MATTTCNSCDTDMSVREARAYVKDGFEIVRCPSCGLVFRAHPPTTEELRGIYGDAYFASPKDDDEIGATGYLDYVADEDLHRVNARKRLQQLQQHAPPGRLLDVGCAAGFFLDEARHAGWDPRGIEVAETMAAWARDRLNLRVEPLPFAQARLEESGYDAVTMWDYIEHSIDPSADVKRARELIAPGGVLALSTGDVGSLAARVFGTRWHLLTPRHHNFFFEPRTLGRMLERSGFEIVSIGHPAAWYTVRYLAHKLRTIVDWPPVAHVAEWLHSAEVGRVQVPVNLWDIMVVVARAR
jgi:2-polyprenyl-3-methyl-5-hydroxy-6-metoxy-1,4-benzoquinol methylase